MELKNDLSSFIRKIITLVTNKPITLHLIVTFFAIIYAIVGGIIFMHYEGPGQHEQQVEVENSIIECVQEVLHEQARLDRQLKAKFVFHNCFKSYLSASEWSASNSILFAFTVMTMIGFGLAPETSGGQSFFMIFALFGIPMSMIVLANIGAHLKEGTCYAIDRIKVKYFNKSKKKSSDMVIGNQTITSSQLDATVEMAIAEHEDPESTQENQPLTKSEEEKPKEEKNQPDEETEMTGSLLIIVFLVYILCGALMLHFLRDDTESSSFIPELYKTFVALTGGDFGQMASGRMVFILLKLLYTSVGIAIATIAIEICSEYLKKLHNFGKKLRNAAKVMIWFGAKQLSVGNLVNAVGKNCSVDPETMESLDIDNMVETAIAEQEGRLPKPEPEPEPEPLNEPEEKPITKLEEAVRIIPNPEPGRMAIQNDPVKRHQVYKQSWEKLDHLMSKSGSRAPRRTRSNRGSLSESHTYDDKLPPIRKKSRSTNNLLGPEMKIEENDSIEGIIMGKLLNDDKSNSVESGKMSNRSSTAISRAPSTKSAPYSTKTIDKNLSKERDNNSINRRTSTKPDRSSTSDALSSRKVDSNRNPSRKRNSGNLTVTNRLPEGRKTEAISSMQSTSKTTRRESPSPSTSKTLSQTPPRESPSPSTSKTLSRTTPRESPSPSTSKTLSRTTPRESPSPSTSKTLSRTTPRESPLTSTSKTLSRTTRRGSPSPSTSKKLPQTARKSLSPSIVGSASKNLAKSEKKTQLPSAKQLT